MTLSTINALKASLECVLEAKIEILEIENFSKGTPLDRDFGHFEASRKDTYTGQKMLQSTSFDRSAQDLSNEVLFGKNGHVEVSLKSSSKSRFWHFSENGLFDFHGKIKAFTRKNDQF